MPAKHLTDAFVSNVKFKPMVKTATRGKNEGKQVLQKQIAYIDNTERGWSLVLVVGYGGTKRFRVLNYVNGKPQSRKLGTYPGMSVKEARNAARDYYENPEKAAAQAEVGSFKAVAENWFKRHVEDNGLRSARDIRRQLKKYVYPKWGDNDVGTCRIDDAVNQARQSFKGCILFGLVFVPVINSNICHQWKLGTNIHARSSPTERGA